MADPVALPASYKLYENMHSAGVVQVFSAPYLPAAADPLSADWVSMGDMSNDGFEFNHKPSYTMREIQQAMYALGAFLTKEELDLKFTLQHMSPDVAYKIGLGVPLEQAVVAATPGVEGSNTTSLGEPNDLIGDTDLGPCNEPEYRQWLFRYAAPGFNYRSPGVKCRYAYYRIWKAAVIDHGSVKHTKTGEATMQLTVKGFLDLSAPAPYQVGKVFIPTPELPI